MEKEKSLPLHCRRMRRFANREQIQVSAPIGCLFFFSYRDFSEGDVDCRTLREDSNTYSISNYEETSLASDRPSNYESSGLEACQSEGVHTLSPRQEREGSESLA